LARGAAIAMAETVNQGRKAGGGYYA
jgi:hypothetical protein